MENILIEATLMKLTLKSDIYSAATVNQILKGTVAQIEKSVSKLYRKFRIATIYNFAVI